MASNNISFINWNMLLLVLFPILNIYLSPVPFLTMGQLFFFVLFFIKKHPINLNPNNLPPGYKTFWIWTAVSYAITNLKFGALIPGGLSFFLYTLCLLNFLLNFNIDSFRKYYRLVFIFCSVVFWLQTISYYISGTVFSALLPSLELSDGVPIEDVISDQLAYTRSCSVFREPAHFAQYILPLLAIELFYSKEGKDYIVTPFSLYIILVLLLLRSGNGLVGLAVLLIMKAYQIVLKSNNKKKLVFALVALPIAFLSFKYYIGTEVGEQMLGRSVELENDESAHSYVRVYRGYVVYSQLPLFNKIVGASDEKILSSMPSYLSTGDPSFDLYMNGIQQILNKRGFIGLVLFVLLIIKILKRNEMVSYCLMFMFITLCFVGQLYLSDMMLIVFIISSSLHFKNKTLCIK